MALTSDPWTKTSCRPATLSAWAAACKGVLHTQREATGEVDRLGVFQGKDLSGHSYSYFCLKKETITTKHHHHMRTRSRPPSFSVSEVNQLCSQGLHQQFSSTIMAIDSDENNQHYQLSSYTTHTHSYLFPVITTITIR